MTVGTVQCMLTHFKVMKIFFTDVKVDTTSCIYSLTIITQRNVHLRYIELYVAILNH